jgi:hypothetical protein
VWLDPRRIEIVALLGTLRQPNLETRRVHVDFPAWMVDALDR